METQYMTREEKRERLNRLSEEEWLRWAYVPFVVAEGAWDYADSVINIAAQMKMTETKKLCRTIRDLKRSYDVRRQRYSMTGSGHELKNFMVMEDVSENSFKYMYACVRDSIVKSYPELSEDYVTFLTAVYACINVLDVLYKYMEIEEQIVCEKCGFETISSILPVEVHALRHLMPEFVGDKPVKIKGCGIFVHNIVRNLCRTKLTNNANNAE